MKGLFRLLCKTNNISRKAICVIGVIHLTCLKSQEVTNIDRSIESCLQTARASEGILLSQSVLSWEAASVGCWSVTHLSRWRSATLTPVNSSSSAMDPTHTTCSAEKQRSHFSKQKQGTAVKWILNWARFQNGLKRLSLLLDSSNVILWGIVVSESEGKS